MTRKYKFLKWCRDYINKKLRKEHTHSYGCNSRCPRCKRWEHEDNEIITVEYYSGGSVLRSCTQCRYKWRAIFTPCGFVPVEDK